MKYKTLLGALAISYATSAGAQVPQIQMQSDVVNQGMNTSLLNNSFNNANSDGGFEWHGERFYEFAKLCNDRKDDCLGYLQDKTTSLRFTSVAGELLEELCLDNDQFDCVSNLLSKEQLETEPNYKAGILAIGGMALVIFGVLYLNSKFSN